MDGNGHTRTSLVKVTVPFFTRMLLVQKLTKAGKKVKLKSKIRTSNLMTISSWPECAAAKRAVTSVLSSFHSVRTRNGASCFKMSSVERILRLTIPSPFKSKWEVNSIWGGIAAKSPLRAAFTRRCKGEASSFSFSFSLVAECDILRFGIQAMRSRGQVLILVLVIISIYFLFDILGSITAILVSTTPRRKEKGERREGFMTLCSCAWGMSGAIFQNKKNDFIYYFFHFIFLRWHHYFENSMRN